MIVGQNLKREIDQIAKDKGIDPKEIQQRWRRRKASISSSEAERLPPS